jgi:hypothetical protein
LAVSICSNNSSCRPGRVMNSQVSMNVSLSILHPYNSQEKVPCSFLMMSFCLQHDDISDASPTA